MLPTIVVVTHLGDLPTMRRWFGGSGYGIPINRYLWASFILLICMPTTAAVTCRTCFDQIQGCTGGDDCPFVATTTQNGLLHVAFLFSSRDTYDRKLDGASPAFSAHPPTYLHRG